MNTRIHPFSPSGLGNFVVSKLRGRPHPSRCQSDPRKEEKGGKSKKKAKEKSDISVHYLVLYSETNLHLDLEAE